MIVSELYLYPVKSCRGILVQEAEVTRCGFRHDREYLVVDAGGVFVTQRTTPALALVEPELSDGGLRLRAPKLAPLEIPWELRTPTRLLNVKIWHDAVDAWDAGDEPAAWFSEYLGQPCRLVRIGTGFRRGQRPGRSQEGTCRSRLGRGREIWSGFGVRLPQQDATSQHEESGASAGEITNHRNLLITKEIRHGRTFLFFKRSCQLAR